MHRIYKKRVRIAAILAVISIAAPQALSDSLMTIDGKTLTGKLRKTPIGYAVETANGRIEVAQKDVKQIRIDVAAASPANGHRVVDPAEVASLLDLGRNAMAAGDFQQARDYFKDAVQLVPQDLVAARGLGIAYLKLEKPLQAADSLKTAAPKPVDGLDRTLTMPMASALVTCVGLPDVNLFQPVPKEMSVVGRPQSDAWSVSFEKSPRLPGAPLIASGQVVGVELGDCDTDLEKVPAATLKALQELTGNPAPAGAPARDPRLAIVMITATK